MSVRPRPSGWQQLSGVLFCFGVVALGALIYGLTTRELTARSDQILHRAAAVFCRCHRQAWQPKSLKRSNAMPRIGPVHSAVSDGRLLTGNIPPPPGLEIDNPRTSKLMPALVQCACWRLRARNGQIILLARDISEIRYLERHILIVIMVSCLCDHSRGASDRHRPEFPTPAAGAGPSNHRQRVAAGDFACVCPFSETPRRTRPYRPDGQHNDR